MRTILILFLFSWPWSAHKESFSVTLDRRGHGEYVFVKKFKTAPSCTFSGPILGKAITMDKIELWGGAGVSVAVVCK